MAVVENWYPPTRENWELIVQVFKFFPVVTIFQWVISWYGQGKTSVTSRLNVPGKIGWFTMEVPSFLTVLYCMYTIPTSLRLEDLPRENKILAGMFTIHYLNRAILSPIIAPSMSPIHVLVWFSAVCFNVINGLSIGGWLAGYGPTTRADWQDKDNYQVAGRIQLGMIMFFFGFIGNIYHDDELREIRRAAIRNARKREEAADESTGKQKPKKNAGDKVYMIPQNGLFRVFVVNEITTMLPRALQGKRWYIERFGEEKIDGRKAILPGIL